MNTRYELRFGGGMGRSVLLALLVALVRLLPAVAAGEQRRVPPQEAELELLVPKGTRVSINGEDKGTQRSFTYEGFERGQLYPFEVMVQFPNGGKARRTVLLRGGWHVRMPVTPSGASKFGLVVQTGHTNSVQSVAFSPDGKHVLTGSWDKTAILWEAQTGQKLRTFQGHTSFVWSVAFSPDGKHVLTGSWDKTAMLWDAQTGQKLRTFQGHNHWVWSVAFSPDGKQVLTGSSDTTALLWDAQTGQKLRTFQGPASGTVKAAFSPDGKQVLTSADNTAILWDAQSGQKLRAFQGHPKLVLSVAFSPDGKQVLTGSADDTAMLWNAHTGQKLRTFQGHTVAVGSVAFSPDGKHVLTGSGDNTAMLWEAHTGQKLRTFQGHADGVFSVAFSPDGKHILTGSADNTALLWDAQTGQMLHIFQRYADWVSSVAFSPDGKQILTGSSDGTAILWDAQTGQKPRAFQGHTNWVHSVAFSADGKHVVTGSNDKTAILWDAQTGQKLRTFQGHTNYVLSVAFSADGKHVLTGSWDGTAKLWDVQTGQKLHTFQGHAAGSVEVAFSPDGKQVLTGSGDKTAMLWDAQTGQKLRTFQGHTNWVGSAAFSPDGKQVLTGSGDKTAMLWDAQTGQKLRTFQGHTDSVFSVAFSPDGKHVLTGSRDNTAMLWDAQTGQKLRTFQGHTTFVESVVFSPDGKHILTGSWDSTTRLWDIATGEELARLISRDAGRDWLVVTPEGLFDGSADGRQHVSYRIGTGLNVVPVDRFFQDFYRPGLLAAVFKGERPMPEVDLAKSRPPTLRILSPKDGGIVEDIEVTLEAETVDEGGGVQGPRLFHNGARVLTAADVHKDGKTIKSRFTVSLIQGNNRLEVKAASADGSWESEPATITLRYEKKLAKPRLLLVAVGISKYAQGSYRLQYARADAEALAELFKKRGGILYDDPKPILLLDEDATRDHIRKTLKEVAAKARPQDTLMLFVAGHGSMVGQRYYLLPHDFRIAAGESSDDAIRKQGIPADVLADFLSQGAALKRMLILDTCASGGATDLFRVASRNPFAFRGEVERLSRSQGIHVLAAAAATEEAKEPEQLGHGVLSYTLLAALKAVNKGPLERISVQASRPGQVIDVLEWFAFAAGHVPRLTKEYCGQEQNVHTAGRGGSFPILPLEEP